REFGWYLAPDLPMMRVGRLLRHGDPVGTQIGQASGDRVEIEQLLRRLRVDRRDEIDVLVDLRRPDANRRHRSDLREALELPRQRRAETDPAEVAAAVHDVVALDLVVDRAEKRMLGRCG